MRNEIKTFENSDNFTRVLKQLESEQKEKWDLSIMCDEQKKAIAIQNQQIAEMKAGILYHDIVSICKEVVPLSAIAKDYGWSIQSMNSFLCDNVIQFPYYGTWILYEKYARSGYTCTRLISHETDGITYFDAYTFWTQKGRLFLYELLKEHGILPLVELNCDNKEEIKVDEKKTKFPLPAESFGDLTREQLEEGLRSEYRIMSETYINYKRMLPALNEDGKAQVSVIMNAAKWSLDYCVLRAIEESIVLEEIPVRNSVGNIIKVIRYPCDTSVSDMVLPTEADLTR